MSIRDLSVKQLRSLAQQRLGPRGAHLKTRDELVAALERWEAKQPRKAPGPKLSPAPLPIPPHVPSQAANVPKITAPEHEQPSTISNHFFLDPGKARLPSHYEDDQVLTFARDPGSLYAAWDFSASQFDHGAASGTVVTEQGAPVRSFAVAGPSGGAFVEQLPSGVPLRVEVRRADEVLGASDWIVLPQTPKHVEETAASSALWPTDG